MTLFAPTICLFYRQRLFFFVHGKFCINGVGFTTYWLASGFDWKPVVEQLIALEAIPKSRLEEKNLPMRKRFQILVFLKASLIH